MAILIVLATFVYYCQGQFVLQPSENFTVPASAFHQGGTVTFAGSSLTDICRKLMAFGGKEALSDGMGAAAKYFAYQKIPGAVAGGNDPQMQCLYQQATGSMMPGMVGATDPGNMFGDYFDTVIEYPMILDPCANPQCNGKVNPTVLLMQAFAPRMGMGMTGMGGITGTSGFPGMGGMTGTSGFPGMGGMTGTSSFPGTSMGGNPMASMYSNNPLMAMLTGMTNSKQPAVPMTPTVAPTKTQQSTGGFPTQFAQMMQMFQNPQMAQMFKQFMSSQGVPSSGPSPMMPSSTAMPVAMTPDMVQLTKLLQDPETAKMLKQLLSGQLGETTTTPTPSKTLCREPETTTSLLPPEFAKMAKFFENKEMAEVMKKFFGGMQPLEATTTTTTTTTNIPLCVHPVTGPPQDEESTSTLPPGLEKMMALFKSPEVSQIFKKFFGGMQLAQGENATALFTPPTPPTVPTIAPISLNSRNSSNV